MADRQPLCAALWAKIEEQAERTIHLIGLAPVDRLDWRPAADAWTVSQLLGHLLDAFAGVCAVLAAAEPGRLAHFRELRGLAVNHACTPDEARTRIELYAARIGEGFAVLCDSDLARPIPTVFVPAGEPLLTLLLGNLEHLVNHKHQLFAGLQQMGIRVNSADLYRFRGAD